MKNVKYYIRIVFIASLLIQAIGMISKVMHVAGNTFIAPLAFVANITMIVSIIILLLIHRIEYGQMKAQLKHVDSLKVSPPASKNS